MLFGVRNSNLKYPAAGYLELKEMHENAFVLINIYFIMTAGLRLVELLIKESMGSSVVRTTLLYLASIL